MELTFAQSRVLGSLIEKQMTTPDYYPMTVNALVAACNQRNNREPVTAFDGTEVERLLGELNDLDLARFTRQSGGRTLKYLHRAPDTLGVDDEQLAILAIMMLRGPQTLSELKSRTERYVDFPSLDAVEARVTDLITRDEQLVEQLPRATGQREDRFMTLLVPDHPANAASERSVVGAAPSSGANPGEGEPARSDLESRVADLERTVAFLLEELGMEAPGS
ncbi:MAG: YceH family protein [Acidimicrobiia bacterium]|nr:YceH family protein [Acidimicrobiia bacterium]